MEKKPYNIIRYLLSLGLAALLLWLCFRRMSWSEWLSALAACRWGWVLVSMLLGVCVFVLRALRHKMLIRPLDPAVSTLTVLNAVNIGYLVNLALSRIGELVRVGVITRHSSLNEKGERRASFDKVLGTVFLDRIWDALVALLLILLLVLLLGGRYAPLMQGLLHGKDAGSPSFLPLLLLALGLSALLYGFAIWRLRGRHRFFARQWEILRHLAQGMATCLRMENSWLFFLYTAAIWALYVVMIACVAEAFSLSALDGWDCVFLMAVGSVASIIPVPGGFGAYHYVVAWALSALGGLPFAAGLVFATVSHESQVLTQILCGLISLLSESFRKTTI